MTKVGCLWCSSALLGTLVVTMGVIAILDPRGVQMANDADPFGTPPSAWFSAALILGGLVLLLRPLPIVVRRRRNGERGR